MRETRIRGSKHGCHLRRRDIEDLILTSGRDIEDKDPTISTEQDNVVISEKTLPELEEEVGHPKRLTNITIHFYANQKSIYINIDAGWVYYRVEGSDSTWVNGRFAEVEHILKKTQSRFLWPYYILIVLSSIALLVLTTSALAHLTFGGGLIPASAGVLLFALLIAFFVALFIFALRGLTNLIILRHNGHAPPDPIAIASLVVAVITAIITAVQVILTVRSR